MRRVGVMALLLLVSSTVESISRVSIRVQEDGRVISCTVPKHADNRTLYIGVVGWHSSGRQLDGEKAPITHRFEMKRLVPCGEDEDHATAFCDLVFLPHHSQLATLNIPCAK